MLNSCWRNDLNKRAQNGNILFLTCNQGSFAFLFPLQKKTVKETHLFAG